MLIDCTQCLSFPYMMRYSLWRGGVRARNPHLHFLPLNSIHVRNGVFVCGSRARTQTRHSYKYFTSPLLYYGSLPTGEGFFSPSLWGTGMWLLLPSLPGGAGGGLIFFGFFFAQFEISRYLCSRLSLPFGAWQVKTSLEQCLRLQAVVSQ